MRCAATWEGGFCVNATKRGRTFCGAHNSQRQRGTAFHALNQPRGPWRAAEVSQEARERVPLPSENEPAERCPRCCLRLPHASCLPPLVWFAQRRAGTSSGLEVGLDRDGE